MAIETYSPVDVLMNVNHNALFEFSDGDMVTVEMPDGSFKTSIGADGFGARGEIASRMIRFTLTLQQTSPSNDYLASLLRADEFTKTSTFPVELMDGRGRTICGANEAYIVGKPEAGFKKDMETRKWVIEAVAGEMNVGGNLI